MDYFISVHPRSNVRFNTMADMNVRTNDAPAEQAPAIAPPTRTDDQIFSAFMASSIIPAIYIQQFWDTMCFDSSTGLYNCQLDEQWFNLHKDILRDALNITPTNDSNSFVAPPSSDTVIEYVNTLGYPYTIRNVSIMSVNALYEPWRAILSMINMCLTGKTTRYDRTRHLVLQILWVIIHRSNIDYAKRIWEEFVQSIQTFLTNKKNLTTASRRKKKSSHLLIPSVRFTKLIIRHLKTKHNIHPRTGSPLYYSHEENVLNTLRFVRKDGRKIFGMPIPDALLTDAIKRAPYYSRYLEHVVEYQRYLDEEHDKAEEEEAVTESPNASKATKPKAAKQTKPSVPKAAKVTKPADDKTPKPTSSQPPKPTPAPTEPSKKDQGVPEKEHVYNEEEANLQRALELILQDQGERTQGRARPVVIREPYSGRIQWLPDVQGKGKEKVVEEQAAHDLLTLYTPKKKSPADQFIFQRCTPMPTEPFGHAKYPSLDAELALTDSETESDEEAGPNHGKQDEGQARSNPGDAVESQPQSSHVVHAGPNLEHMDMEVTDTLTQQNPEQINKEFTTTAYLNVWENLKLPTKDQAILEDPASSTGTLSSLQNLDKELSFTNQFFVEKPQKEEPNKTNTELEVQSMVMVPIHQDTSSVPQMITLVIDLTVSQPVSTTVQAPLPTSTKIVITITTTTSLPPPPSQPRQSTTDPILVRRIAELEQHMVSKAVDEIVTDAVDWAMQAPLQARFSDLPACDYSNQLLEYLDEARRKKRKRRVSPRTPLGSPPSPPPHPPPLASASGAPGTSGASGSSQLPPPPLLHLLVASLGLKSYISDAMLHDDYIPEEQVHFPNDEEERLTTPEPAWTIPSSNMSGVENNWASALVSTYETSAENSLLVKTRDMTTFMNWYCRQVNRTKLTQADFEGQDYKVVEAFYPDVIHLQFQIEEYHKIRIRLTG
ncbi:retrovirus-related pol polyprotein from transposon TNT 1-94 [Tanacetum coccineum]|uniref:Retrovirus-related pol polyprotein from transposon TNT 1-94 n=1 Tax=Tanacetum coccineum TaxID=301880 RepID=A0ABQ5IPR2_9ASTR